MNRFRTRLSLQTLDDRIVPDGTPLAGTFPVTPMPTTTTTTQYTTTPVSTSAPAENLDRDADIKERDRLTKQIADNNATIASNVSQIAQQDENIACAQALLASLKAESVAIVARRAAVQKELQDLMNAGIMNGPEFDAANRKMAGITEELILNGASQRRCSADIDNFKNTKAQLEKANIDLRAANVELQKNIDALNQRIGATPVAEGANVNHDFGSAYRAV